jgi:hypothetical protein
MVDTEMQVTGLESEKTEAHVQSGLFQADSSPMALRRGARHASCHDHLFCM